MIPNINTLTGVLRGYVVDTKILWNFQEQNLINSQGEIYNLPQYKLVETITLSFYHFPMEGSFSLYLKRILLARVSYRKRANSDQSSCSDQAGETNWTHIWLLLRSVPHDVLSIQMCVYIKWTKGLCLNLYNIDSCLQFYHPSNN